MIKKVLPLFFLAFLCTTYSLSAERTRLEFRSAAFFPTSDLFRKIYGNVGADYQLQASTGVWKCLDIWTNLDWFPKSGHSIGFHDHTRVNIGNLSLGLNFVYPFNCKVSGYLGAGPSFGGIWLKNDFHEHGSEMVRRFVFGGAFKSGIYFSITSRFFLDVFVDYLYQRVHFERHVNIGGVKVGAGIGVKF